MNKEKEKKLIEECLDEMYQACDPPITWKEILAKYSNTGMTFFDKHYITEEKYNEIRNKYYVKLSKIGKKALDWVLLDLSPSFHP